MTHSDTMLMQHPLIGTRRTQFLRLDPTRIAQTAESISSRLRGAFPTAGLGEVSVELAALASETAQRVQEITRPHWPIRIATWSLSGLFLILTVIIPAFIRLRTEVDGISDFLQGLEAGVNVLIFCSAAVWFLFTLEQRHKRRAALAALHELRSVAHIIDLHQLSKDPESVMGGRGPGVASSTTRTEMAAYLDFCTELLSVVSKLAALYAQGMSDSQVLSAVNDVEQLCSAFTQETWQKTMILDVVAFRQPMAMDPDAESQQ